MIYYLVLVLSIITLCDSKSQLVSQTQEFLEFLPLSDLAYSIISRTLEFLHHAHQFFLYNQNHAQHHRHHYHRLEMK